MAEQITEANARKQWNEEASKVTLDTLHEFVRHLTSDYELGYGTICHAMAAAMRAAMSAVDKSGRGGITGFQAGCVMWEVLEHSFRIKGRLVQYEDLLYPQYERKFNAISRETFAEVRKLAQERLAKGGEMHHDVRAHMERIAERGEVPFGLVLADD